MKSRMHATAPIRSTFAHKRSTVSRITIESNSSNMPMRHKCWLCSNSAHWPDQCTKFAALNVDDRYKAAKENHVCFSCLKKAGRDHKAVNCSRRQQCSKVENGVRCNGFHHHLLHKEKTNPAGVGVAIASNDREAILPVISANISNSKGFFKRGNVLLDSGAQISLIRQETAEALGLNGQDVAVTITKVGGEEETLTAKKYTVTVSPINDSKQYFVKAIGIPVISDDIRAVNTARLSEMFGLQTDKFRRGKGPVDLLIGIDYAYMHSGETKQVDHLMARQSPIGWVIFGARPGETCDATHILHVKYATPVDLAVFWTTEAMGVNALKAEKEEAKVIAESCVKMGNQWLVPYP
eukprot:Seg9160.1 transcript_id=Seg9160.1/GoldUCD/mRNA.D3Y31 product="hypothetical protein" protein_id=Seg9160.1/GoldUCD/D3Y31